MDTLEIIRSLAIIIIFSKFFGLCARKIKAPEVAGEIIAGLLIGPSVFNFVQKGDFIAGMAEIGVILLMFSAGLDTNINQLKKSGIKATILPPSPPFPGPAPGRPLRPGDQDHRRPEAVRGVAAES